MVACILCKLLLDEEVFQVGKLPRAGDSENCELDENPADDAGICGFRLVSEFSFALTLEDLLPPDVGKAIVQILDSGGYILELVLVGTLYLAGLANGKVESQANAAIDGAGRKPIAAARITRGRKADPVITRLSGAEGEASRSASLLGHYAVVIVKEFIDRYVDTDSVMTGPCSLVVIVLLGLVAAHDHGVLRQLLKEAFRGSTVDVKV